MNGPLDEIRRLREENAQLRALIAAPDREVEYRHQLAREAAEVGRERARSEGYAEAIGDVKAAEHALHDYLKDMPTEAERWALRGEPRTRATFAEPHPDDYQGGPVKWPEPVAERRPFVREREADREAGG